MAAAADSVKRIHVGELRRFVAEEGELAKGTALFDGGQLKNLARYQNKLFGEAKGSGPSPYKVTLTYKEAPAPEFKSQCSCPVRWKSNASSCKHAAALLVAWARAPESFVVSEGPPGGAGAAKRKEVKKGKVSAGDLMKAGVDQVSTLVRELGVSGVASIGADRVEQIQTLGQTLRENKLRRLSARALDLAALIAPAKGSGARGAAGLSGGVLDALDARHVSGAIAADAYTGLLADLLLTARKLEKHLSGEPLDDRHVEELIGKTWQKGDRKPVADLHLVEYAFMTQTTSDDYVIRESRFFDVASGSHYSEKQILPAFLAKRTEPKPSRSGHVLGGARGTTFPGYPPFRVDFDDLGDKRPVDAVAFAAIVEKALPDVGVAIGALQEHRKDVFAPDLLPVALRVETLFARGPRLQVVDEKGHALHVPADRTLEELLGAALRGAKLRALLGDVGLDAALPTLWPVAAVIEGPLGLELCPLTDPGALAPRGPRKGPASARPAPGAGSAWAAAARASGASQAAIALGEVREELAEAFLTGLAGLTPRGIDPLASRLRDLGLEKQAALLQSIAARPEPAGRLDDFIKLYQVLEIALVRLAGATHVDRDAIERVPTYESVFVARTDKTLSPKEVELGRARGELNRYQAAVHYARYYSELPAEQLSTDIFPIWADGSASSSVVGAFASRGAEGIRAAERALTTQAGRVAQMTAIQVLHAIAGGGDRAPGSSAHIQTAEAMLVEIARTCEDAGLRGMARDALDTLDAAQGGGERVRQRRAKELDQVNELATILLSAPTRDERREALSALALLGHRTALPFLRQVFWSDASRDVRHSAALALAHLGDTDMVEAFLRMLSARAENEQDAKVAAVALGHLGDVRGLNELLLAYAEGYKPGVVAEAIRAFGPMALDPLIELIEAKPEIAKRTAALVTLQQMEDQDLSASLIRRLEARRGQPDAASKAQLYVKLADVHPDSRRRITEAVIAMFQGSEGKEAMAASKAAHKALSGMKRKPG